MLWPYVLGIGANVLVLVVFYCDCKWNLKQLKGGGE